MNDGCRPILLLSPSRSGSTLVSRVLNAHPQIAMMYETGMLTTLGRLGCRRRFRSRAQYLAFLQTLWAGSERVNSALAAAVLELASDERPPSVAEAICHLGQRFASLSGASRWAEKTPANLLRLDAIGSVLPDADHVHLVRDPRDAVGSILRVWAGSSFRDADLIRAIAQIKIYLQNLEKAGRRWPHVMVRYEDMVTRPADSMASVFAFVHLPFPEGILEPPEVDEVASHLAATIVHDRLLDPIDARSVGRSSEVLSTDQLAIVERCLEDEMRIFGYAPKASAKQDWRSQRAAVNRRVRAIRIGLVDLPANASGHLKVLAAETPLIRRLPYVVKRTAPEEVWRARQQVVGRTG